MSTYEWLHTVYKEQRYQIEALLKAKYMQTEIAGESVVPKSTIRQELLLFMRRLSAITALVSPDRCSLAIVGEEYQPILHGRGG